MRNVSDRIVEKIKTYAMFNNFLLLENLSVYENLEKYCIAGQVTVDNMAHEHCMVDT